MKVVVAAAGIGSKFFPLATRLPKEMFPVIDKPVLQYVIEEALHPGIDEIILVINKNKKMLFDYLLLNTSPEFQKLLKGIKLTVTYQTGNKYGDAIPILCAEKYVKNLPFLVLWADCFSLRKFSRIKELLRIYEKYKKPAVSFVPISAEQTAYSAAVPRIKRVNGNLITFDRMFKNPGPIHAPALLTAPSGFILEPEIFNYIKNLKSNKTGEYCLIDAIDDYCKKNLMYGLIFKKPFFEAGNPKDLIKTIMRIPFYRDDLKDIKKEIVKFSKMVEVL